MEHCMKEVLVRTKPKDSFTHVVSYNSANIQTVFSRDYELKAINGEIARIRGNSDVTTA